MSYQPILIASPLRSPRTKGYFERAGLNVELIELWQCQRPHRRLRVRRPRRALPAASARPR